MIILTVPDIHAPNEHRDALDFLSDLQRHFKPDKVVFLGDEVDANGFSRFAKDPDLDSPGFELQRAREHLRPFYKLFPKAYVCESNHTVRPWVRAAEAGLPTMMMRDVRDVLDAPKTWKWKMSWRFDGTLFLHGDGFSGKNAALNAAERHRCCVVIGHVHSHAGIQYNQGHNDCVWGMNAGCLIDETSPVFRYAKHMANRPVLGAGVVADGVPFFLPLKAYKTPQP